MQEQDYDAIPYESTPIADAHPYKLAALGRLLGLNPPEPATSRILELGCAEGGTIIPLARLWPNAQILGLELSAGQTRSGNELITALGLNNIRIQQADILQVDASLGEFDYIIAHGVFSWVPNVVQEKMFDICRRHLSPQGLVYISYNVNPGWRLRGALRDMFAFHLRGETSPHRKLERALELCEMIDKGLGNSTTLMANYLRQEIGHLRKARKAYVYHEYLESTNDPVLFSDFVNRAEQHALRYLCDTELYTMFPSSFGTAAQTMLEQFDDLQTTEQYADFLRMRTFRQSVLCHAAQTPSYEIDLAVLEQLAVYSNLTPEKAPNLRSDRSDNFLTIMGKSIPISHPLTKAILLQLEARYPDAVPLPELIGEAQRFLHANKAEKYAGQPQEIRGELFNLFANNLIGLATSAMRFPVTRDSLKVTDFARLQAQRPDGFLSTTWSETLSLDKFSTRLIELLDGTRSKAQIITQLVEDFKHDKPAVIPSGVEKNVERLLGMFARNGILI